MIKELDTVVLDVDLPEYHLEKGDIGTVVLVHQNNKGYEVEFITLEGETLVVISLFPSQIRTVQKREIPHVRLVA
ncbi:MAG: DUF4926 domain-containing protein [Methylococcaceae bacterium]|jgi:hypothetical protein